MQLFKLKIFKMHLVEKKYFERSYEINRIEHIIKSTLYEIEIFIKEVQRVFTHIESDFQSKNKLHK